MGPSEYRLTDRSPQIIKDFGFLFDLRIVEHQIDQRIDSLHAPTALYGCIHVASELLIN